MRRAAGGRLRLDLEQQEPVCQYASKQQGAIAGVAHKLGLAVSPVPEVNAANLPGQVAPSCRQAGLVGGAAPRRLPRQRQQGEVGGGEA